MEMNKIITEESHAALMKATKADLVRMLVDSSQKQELYRLRCQTAFDGEKEFRDEIKSLSEKLEVTQDRLEKAEEYNEQARSMLDAVMERWYKYND